MAGKRSLDHIRFGRWLTPLVIAVVAAALRLGNLGLAEFKFDEARSCVLAREIAHHGARPVVDGSTSLGISAPPGALYFYALPGLFSYDPRALVAALALTNVLAVVVCYHLVRRFFGERTALVAGFLYAVNPWAILEGRKIWAHILPLLTVLALYCLYKMIVERKGHWAVPFFVFLALQGQMYPVAIFLVPGAVLVLALFWRRLDWRFLLVGVALGVGLSLPYGRYLLIHRQELVEALSGASGGSLGRIDLGAFKLLLWQVSGFGVQGLLGQGEPFFQPYALLLWVLLGMAAVLLPVGIAWASFSALPRGPGYERYALLILWAVPPLLALSFWPLTLYPHYLSILYPSTYILLALPLGRLLASPRRLISGLAALAVLGMGFGQGNALLTLEGYLERYGGGGGFGLSLGYWQEVAAEAKELGGEILIASRGDDPHQCAIPAIFTCLLEPERWPRYLDWREEQRVLVLPRGEGILVVPSQLRQTYGDEMRAFTEEVASSVPSGTSGNEGRSVIYRLRQPQGYGFPPPFATRREVRLSNGIMLLGYHLPTSAQPGDTLQLNLYLAFQSLPPEVASRRYVFYNHLLDVEHKRWAQLDGFGWARRFWREGEVALAHFELALPQDIPPGQYTLRTGMYDLDTGERAKVLDEQGNVVGDGVELGKLVVR